MKRPQISNKFELEIRREFSNHLKNFRAQKIWIEDAIGGIVQHDLKNLYDYDIRVKDISSVLAKIEGKRIDERRRVKSGELTEADAKWINAKTYSNIENIIDDWIGCRIISYLHDSITPLHKEIISHNRFKIIRIIVHDSIENRRLSHIKLKKKRDETRLNHTGYVGIHYIIEPITIDPCWGKEPKIFHKFELQVRTLLQEAWGEIQHAVIYKGRMPEFMKKERSDSFGSLARLLAHCDTELARLAKDPEIQKLAKPKQSHLNSEKPENE